MWSSSPSSISVEPRGGMASAPRTITLTTASRGSRRSRTGRPTAASPGLDPERVDLAAEAPDRPALDQGAGEGGLVRRQPEAARERLEARPLDQRRGDDHEEDDVEDLVAALDPGDHGEGREPDRDRAAQPRPAEHQALPAGRTSPAGSPRARRAGARRTSARPRAAGRRGRPRRARWGRPAGRAGRTARSARPSRAPGGRRGPCACRAPARCPRITAVR